ncbi:MAG: hypothetical protein VX587_03185 [Thermoproteota archaeon]|nr:hypothetical protein [Thermoproteota archaeon]
MVLPLVDEDKPKCFLCHDTFDDYENLRKHQEFKHKDFFEYHEKQNEKGPTPGDVSIF